MNPQGTSFIPQRPVQGAPSKRSVRKIYILTYISYIVFFGTLLAVAATFFFTVSLDAQLKSQQELLALEKQKFSQSDIETVRALSKQIEVSQERMNKHVSVVSIFEALEKSAVESLEFTGFTYERLLDEAPEITLVASAPVFNSLLFQRQVMFDNPVFLGSTFTEVKLGEIADEEGAEDKTITDPDSQNTITLEIKNTVDTSSIQYVPRFDVLNSTAEDLSGLSDMVTTGGVDLVGNVDMITE